MSLELLGNPSSFCIRGTYVWSGPGSTIDIHLKTYIRNVPPGGSEDACKWAEPEELDAGEIKITADGRIAYRVATPPWEPGIDPVWLAPDAHLVLGAENHIIVLLTLPTVPGGIGTMRVWVNGRAAACRGVRSYVNGCHDPMMFDHAYVFSWDDGQHSSSPQSWRVDGDMRLAGRFAPRSMVLADWDAGIGNPVTLLGDGNTATGVTAAENGQWEIAQAGAGPDPATPIVGVNVVATVQKQTAGVAALRLITGLPQDPRDLGSGGNFVLEPPARVRDPFASVYQLRSSFLELDPRTGEPWSPGAIATIPYGVIYGDDLSGILLPRVHNVTLRVATTSFDITRPRPVSDTLELLWDTGATVRFVVVEWRKNGIVVKTTGFAVWPECTGVIDRLSPLEAGDVVEVTVTPYTEEGGTAGVPVTRTATFDPEANPILGIWAGFEYADPNHTVGGIDCTIVVNYLAPRTLERLNLQVIGLEGTVWEQDVPVDSFDPADILNYNSGGATRRVYKLTAGEKLTGPYKARVVAYDDRGEPSYSAIDNELFVGATSGTVVLFYGYDPDVFSNNMEAATLAAGDITGAQVGGALVWQQSGGAAPYPDSVAVAEDPTGFQRSKVLTLGYGYDGAGVPMEDNWVALAHAMAVGEELHHRFRFAIAPATLTDVAPGFVRDRVLAEWVAPDDQVIVRLHAVGAVPYLDVYDTAGTLLLSKDLNPGNPAEYNIIFGIRASWSLWEIVVKLNTLGVNDGYVELWYEGADYAFCKVCELRNVVIDTGNSNRPGTIRMGGKVPLDPGVVCTETHCLDDISLSSQLIGTRVFNG